MDAPEAPIPLVAVPVDPGSAAPASGSPTIRVERCPRCRTKLLEELPGEVIIRNAILRVESRTGRVRSKCPRCKTWVEVPLRYIG
jgi:phage FluMu protein Com